MLAYEIKTVLSQLESRLGQHAISIRCNCANLEVVYVSLDEGGQVCVSDDHRTFQYLDGSNDSTYVAVGQIDLAAVAAACTHHGVALIPAGEDGFPRIEYKPRTDEPIADAIGKVASAVDAVFQIAINPSVRIL